VIDSTNNKVVVVYQDASDSEKATLIVGTVSGTSISFGSVVEFNSGNTNFVDASYDSFNKKVVLVYRDEGNSDYGTLIVGSVSGTSISFGSEVVFESGGVNWISDTFDSTQKKVVIAYSDGNNSAYGTAIVFQNESTNLTTENFIGFSDAAYSDGQTATIQIISSVDDAQSGLTTGSIHYVQNNGSLSTTAGNPSVVGGTALSSTQISVKL
jgi:hypothetical protein